MGIIRPDQPVFCWENVVTPGDAVAMLIGEDEEGQMGLREKVRVEYEPLPLLTDPEEALDREAPLIHPEFGTNLIVHHRLRRGDLRRGFAESDFVLERRYTTPLVEHAFLEPECVVAVPQPGSAGIRLFGSIQSPFSARRAAARVLGWPLSRVWVEPSDLGGPFGGKDDNMNILAARAALGALKVSRPLKIRYGREESVLESYKRHPSRSVYRVGFMKSGQIKAMEIDILADGGAYASKSAAVTWRTTVDAAGPYQIDHVSTDVRAVYTNNPLFAQESLMDEIARRLEVTPDEVGEINGFRGGSTTASGQKLEGHEVNLLKAMRRAVEVTDFRAKWLRYGRENGAPARGPDRARWAAGGGSPPGPGGQRLRGTGGLAPAGDRAGARLPGVLAGGRGGGRGGGVRFRAAGRFRIRLLRSDRKRAGSEDHFLHHCRRGPRSAGPQGVLSAHEHRDHPGQRPHRGLPFHPDGGESGRRGGGRDTQENGRPAQAGVEAAGTGGSGLPRRAGALSIRAREGDGFRRAVRPVPTMRG